MGAYLLNFSFSNDISRFQVVEVSTSSLGTSKPTVEALTWVG